MTTNTHIMGGLTVAMMMAVGSLALMSAPVQAETAPAALIIAQGGLGDESWNDSANRGFQAGLKKASVKGRPIESKDVVAQAATPPDNIETRLLAGGLCYDIRLSNQD